METQNRKIFVIGSSNTDMVVKTDRLPRPGETVLGGTFMMTPGGKGANQAVTIARLGGDVSFLARIGEDMFGGESLKNYQKAGIDTSLIRRDAHYPSGVALICVDAAAENCIVVAPGANKELCRADVDAVRSELGRSAYLLMQLEVPMETIEYAADLAWQAGVKVILNPAPAAELSPELLKKVYLITPNRSEAELLTGIAVTDTEAAIAAAGRLLGRGVQKVLVTLGSAGSLIVDEAGYTALEARKVEAVDTTAAGDVFNGALCVALAEGKDLREAARFATVAAAVSVTRMGAQSSVPTREEVDDLL